ncbi:MAG: hypothetical protein ABSH49_01325 [Bryobacteraceae bacterium]|jgi:hypothetical protein
MDDRELNLRFQNIETPIASMKVSVKREFSPIRDSLQRIEAGLERDLKIEELTRRVDKLAGK